ncbi:MAG: hypothetical protein IT342_22910 [Candidatus Melainabacteria bacterium]|nr:hypothetical protein [Candidatus Melainabacteria bacterium]
MGKGNMESVKERESRNDANDNSDVSTHVQDELRRNGNLKSKESQANGTKKQDNYPYTNLMLVDGEDNSSVSAVTMLGEGRKDRVLIETGDGRDATADYDEQGNLTRYQDFAGNVYVREVDKFINPRNPVQPEGVDLKVDRETGTAILTDRETGIVKTTTSKGIETTDYSRVGGGKTTCQVKDGVEYISIESPNRPLRTLVIDKTESGSRVRQYTDGEGNTYTVTPEKFDDDGRPIYSGKDRNDNPIGENFRVTADRSGNVVVRNEDQRNTINYARRELNNGTVVMSEQRERTDPKAQRVVYDFKNQVLTNGSKEAETAVESKVVQEAPLNVDLDANVREAHENFVGEGIGFRPYNARYWFYEKVKTGGDWDFKSPRRGDNVGNPQYEDYGNWHYGYIGTAAGINSETLQEQAGVEQQNAATSRPEYGNPSWGGGWSGIGESGTYGDDPRDNAFVKRGIATRQLERQKTSVA